MEANSGTRDVYLEANGLRHHLVARGAPGAPVVVLIHGLTQQAGVFRLIAEHLAEQYHVYALDVRGRGETDWGPPDGYNTPAYVADLEAVREGLGLTEFAIVGTSMGGAIGTAYAATNPERVLRLVLNDMGPELAPEGIERIVKGTQGAPEAFPDLQAVVTWFRGYLGSAVAGLGERDLEAFARGHVRKDDTGLWIWKLDPAIREFRAGATGGDPWTAFEAVQCPVLVLRGGETDVLSSETAAAMVARGRDCGLVEVPGVGHPPLLVEPAAQEALERFLAPLLDEA